MKLTCMRGYSGSGKSTLAARIATDTGAVIVNRDHLRMMMLNSWWTGDKPKEEHKADEDRVTVAEEAQVRALLKAGTSVVVDATHLNAPFLRKWARIATRMGAEFDVVDVHADPVECRKRVYQRWCANQGSDMARYLDPKVVDDQVKRYPVEKWPTVTADPPFVVEPVTPRPDLPDAYIFDIDGTLAQHQGRSPYDYTRVQEDAIDESIRTIFCTLRSSDSYPEMIILSGRDDTCYQATSDWLADNGIYYDWLFMRDTALDRDSRGSKLPDVQVKYRLFNEHVRGRYNVIAVFDDRDQVVQLWRDLGLKCCQVQPGAF